MKKAKPPDKHHECLTLRVEDCANILGISLSSAYSLVEQAYINHAPFKVLRIGKSYRILKASFFDFVECRIETPDS